MRDAGDERAHRRHRFAAPQRFLQLDDAGDLPQHEDETLGAVARTSEKWSMVMSHVLPSASFVSAAVPVPFAGDVRDELRRGLPRLAGADRVDRSCRRSRSSESPLNSSAARLTRTIGAASFGDQNRRV